MGQFIFGLLLLFIGWNTYTNRSWWVEQASKDWGDSRDLFQGLLTGISVVLVIVGLVFVGAGIVVMITKH